MTEQAKSLPEHSATEPGYGTFVVVWAVLLMLTGLLVTMSLVSQRYAVLGLLTITPLKAALVFYYFMHLKYEGTTLKLMVFVTVASLVIFLGLLMLDYSFR